MTSSSQGKWLNCSIFCQSKEEKTNRLLGLFLSDPGRAAVVMQLETSADYMNVKILKEGIKKTQNPSSLICNLVCRAAEDQQGIKPILNILPTVDQNYCFMSPTAQMETANKKVTCLSSPDTSACSSTFSLT